MARPPLIPSPGNQVPTAQKIAIGLGQAASMGTHNAVHTLANPVYNVTFGVNPGYLSVAIFVQRFWDAFLDPLVGQWTDRAQTRWGRRRPFLAAAAVPMALTFGAIWFFPPGLGEHQMIVFFVATSLVFYLFHSLYTVPLAALQIEVASNYHERTRVASVAGICTWLFSIGNQWLFPLLQSGLFPDPASGVRWVTGGVAALYALLACAPFLWVSERLALTPRAATREPTRFWQAFRETARNRDFAILVGVRAVSTFGYALVALLGFYLNVYLVHGGDLRAAGTIQGWLGSAYVVASIVASWGFRVVALRVGKRRALQSAAGMLVTVGIVKLLVYIPGERWWQILVPTMNGIAQAGIALVTISMLADVVDSDELVSGRRREGLYSSVLSWLDKVGSSSGALVSGFLLVWIGFDAKLGGEQSATTLALMKWLYALFPLAAAALTIWLASRYRLDELAVDAIKQQLETRRDEHK